jgi:EPS-associated MarR family transcriptional regulator
MQGFAPPWSGSRVLTDEVRYKLLRLLKANPKLSQREVARELGISLGKVNYCLKALVDKGLVKAINFKNNERKSVYMYLLTPRGIEEKTRVTVRFLQRKVAEYEELRRQIEQIRVEAEALDSDAREEEKRTAVSGRR